MRHIVYRYTYNSITSQIQKFKSTSYRFAQPCNNHFPITTTYMSCKSNTRLESPISLDKTVNGSASYRHRHTYNTRSTINLPDKQPLLSTYRHSLTNEHIVEQPRSRDFLSMRYRAPSPSAPETPTLSSKMRSAYSPKPSIYSPIQDHKHPHSESTSVRACPAPKSRKESAEKSNNDISFTISRGVLSRVQKKSGRVSVESRISRFDLLDSSAEDAGRLRRSTLAACTSDRLFPNIDLDVKQSRRSTLSVYDTPRLDTVEGARSHLCSERYRKAVGGNKVATPAVVPAPEHSFSPLDGVLKTKQTPQKHAILKTPSGRMSLENLLTPQVCHAAAVPALLASLYREQEHDDRDLYKVSSHLAREMTQDSQCSAYVNRLNSNEFVRLLTYGEVSCSSVSETIIPFLDLREDDVFYDLGCGTGKIVVQVAIETACLVSKGIELMKNRVLEGKRALQRLNTNCSQYIVGRAIEIVHGDICLPPSIAPITDASVVFINNVMFGPDLMLKILGVLAKIPNLRRVITLRRICERHRHEKCSRRGDYCVDYVHPPIQADIKVSWADRTSVYCYQRTSTANLPSENRLMRS
uniref:Histone-lysine N-methyltransferase, H3 lysine-79 specific n=1 Tax=Albugo laibachii Nc14 TaxID=890382 RepID=F0W4P2_9STRA|nr:histone methyltransferase putative [Albugo laibachii Nc14]|eukprot:CCA16076.1 histone methyltransferase putative [Albugo laibachii Nc14]